MFFAQVSPQAGCKSIKQNKAFDMVLCLVSLRDGLHLGLHCVLEQGYHLDTN